MQDAFQMCCHRNWTHVITCMKLLASSIPGKESANSVISSRASPDIPPEKEQSHTITVAVTTITTSHQSLAIFYESITTYLAGVHRKTLRETYLQHVLALQSTAW